MTLDRFFYPESVAVVGASRTPGKAGHTILANILEFGYAGSIFPVNPGAGEILGVPSWDSLDALPRTPDLVIAVLPREQTVGLVRECAEREVGSVIIPAAGFSDVGPEGRKLEEEVMRLARGAGITVMGPNSIGTVCTASGLATSIVTLDRLKPGPVSLFGQTGMLASGIARWIDTSERFGISKIACLGNKAGVDETDVLEYMGKDDETRVIGVYTEGVRDGRRFREVLSEVAAAKPVLILKSGRTEMGKRAIASHTGAMAGADGIFTGLVEQAGAVRVGDFEEMLDCAKAFGTQPLPAGNRVGAVSITGLGCVLAADSAGRYGLEFPQPGSETVARMTEALPSWVPAANPADIWAAIEARGAETGYNVVARALADDPSIDSVMAIFTVIPESSLNVAELFCGLREAHPEKPCAAVLMAGDADMLSMWQRDLAEIGVPSYPSPERALRALGAMWKYAGRHDGDFSPKA